jgi:hypothetical protein
MIVANKTLVDLGLISVKDSKQDTVIITNTGLEHVIVSFSSSNALFGLSKISYDLYQNESVFLDVTFFTNTIVGESESFSGDLLITSSVNSLTIPMKIEVVSAGIYVDKTSISFGNVAVNTQKTVNILVSNISPDDVNLIISSVVFSNPVFSGVFNTPFIIKKSESLQIPVTFTSESSGNKTGSLTLQCNDVILSTVIIDLSGFGLAAPNISTSTEMIDFGNVNVGASLVKNFKINNTGIINLNVSNISTNNVAFSVAPSNASIVPGSFTDVNVTFSPASKNENFAKITLISNDSDTPQKTIDLHGSGVSPLIVVSPLVLDFSNVTTNTESIKQILIQNTSTAPLIVSNIVISNSVFSIQETFPLIVTSSKIVDVKFRPTSLSFYEGTFTVTSNDLDKPSISVVMQGSGVHPDISMSPNSLDFGSVALNVPVSLSASITNSGLGNLVISSITCTNTNFQLEQTSLEIEPNVTKSIQITFVATSVGSKNGIVHFLSNDPDTPNLSLSVTGYGDNPTIKFVNSKGFVEDTPSVVDFGKVVTNHQSSKEITIKNTGRVQLSVSVASNSTLFTVSPESLLLNTGTSSTINITFMSETAGEVISSIGLTTNDPENKNVEIEVKAEAVTSPKITVNPTSLVFSGVPVGGSKTLTLTVGNTGDQILDFTTKIYRSTRDEILNIQVPSVNLALTAFDVTPTSGHVDTNGSTILSVSFKPTDLETLGGTLEINSNDVTETALKVSLQGSVIPAVLEWKKINTAQWIPKEIYTLATTLTEVIDPLVSALELTTKVLDVIKMFIVDLSDVMKILLEQIKKTIDDFIKDLAASGLYAIYIMPGQLGINPLTYPQYFRDMPKENYNIFDLNHPSWFDSVKGGYSSFISKLTQSFDDPGDGNRPQLSDTAMVGGYVMMFDSGTVGPDDVGTFVRSIQKLMKLFRSPFKVAFEPPSNVSCFAGNKTVRVTFTPSSSSLPKEYFIFRSETQGGDPVYYEDFGKKYEYHDENGNKLRSYKLIGVTNVIKEIAKIMGVNEKNADSALKEFGYAVKEISKVALNGDPLRFVYEDKNVENNKTYYYVVASGYSTPNAKISTGSLLSTDFQKKVVSEYDSEIGKLVQHEENPKSVSDTKILGIGSLSGEVSAMPVNASFEVKGGLARCRNFRCGFDQDNVPEKFSIGAEVPDFLVIANTPIAGTVRIKVLRNKKEFTASSSSYRVDYQSKTKKGADTKLKEGTVNKIYIKSRYYFKKDDVLIVTYKFKKDLKVVSKLNEPVVLDKNQTFITSKKPIDSTSVKVFKNGTQVQSVTVLNDKDGRVKVNMPPGTSLTVDYDYFSDFSKEQFFKCVRSEYSRYFFDLTKCDAGSTLCTGYDNANCYYNNGSECTNTEKSQRSIFLRQDGFGQGGFEPENIEFKKFWDPISCQNGMMQQRCDGYSKTFPRYTQKVWPDWSSIRLSALGMFPKIEEIMKIMQQMIDSLLAGTEKMSTATTNFIDLLQKKIESLKNLLLTIKSFLLVLTEDFALPDLYFLRIPYGKGGNEYLKTSIANATNGPESDPSAYTAGAMFVYATPGLGNALKLFFG